MVVSAQKPYICVLEDDAAVRDSLRLMLERNGFSVRTFNSPNEFLLATEIDRYNCLVVDFQLPGMSGLDLMKRLADRGSTTPVVLITACSDANLEAKAAAAGAACLLRKPFEMNDLIKCIEGAVKD